MSPPRLLVVEDDDHIRAALRLALEDEGYEVVEAASGEDGLVVAGQTPADVMLVDLMLGGMDGFSFIREIRRSSDVPIVVVSARADTHDIVAGLEAGADDYVTKPFGMDELLARLRAAVRRGMPAAPEDPVVRTAAFTVDLAAKRVTDAAGEEVRLTPTEWHLLEVLARNPGRLVSQRQLLQEVWGPGYAKETHYLRVYLAQLRRKLEPEPGRPRFLRTEPGLGYRLEVGPQP